MKKFFLKILWNWEKSSQKKRRIFVSFLSNFSSYYNLLLDFMTYYTLIMSQNDFFENQVFEEILRERANYCFSKNKSVDFWISLQPKFLEEILITSTFLESNFFTRVKTFRKEKKITYVCLISPNKEFINWVQLRLGYFENIFLEKKSLKEKKFYSDGFYVEIKDVTRNFLESQASLVEKNILVTQYSSILNFLKA